MESYVAAGAQPCSGMGAGDVIFGVKEIPIEKILDNKIYVFFSHTIKGQPDNMPLLRRIMDSGSSLIDYERITDADNLRTVYFGPYAGHAGAIDILALMGENWAAHGVKTPLEQVKRAHEYQSLADAKKHLEKVGRTIKEQGFPESAAPFTVGVLGYGNVSKGAQEVLNCLPVTLVPPGEMAAVAQGDQTDRRSVYVSIFKEKDLVQTKSGSLFDLQEYYHHPDRYESIFEAGLPFFSLLINAVYWEKRYPRFITWDGLKRLYETHPLPKLRAIADISCDSEGSVECNIKSTDSDMPAYQVHPLTRETTDGHTGEGIVLLAVDNLPCELPHDSSTFFSNRLSPLAPSLLQADFSAGLDQSGLCPELKKAVIVYNGELTPDHAYLKKFI